MHDIFYFTDVHGCYDLYRAAIDYCFKQDPECMIVYGGDACDRGTSGYQIMKELLDNPRVVYLKGNHEDLFVRAAQFIARDYDGAINSDEIWNYLYNCEVRDYGSAEVQLHIYNGGFHTLYDWMMDGMPMEFVNRINDLPITFSTDTLDFCHAGGRYKEFQQVARDEYDEQLINADDLMMTIWDRNYPGQGWAPDRTCIFGHTPTIHLPSKYYGRDKSIENIHPCAYNALLDDKWTGRKVDMDVATAISGKLYVLDCFTMNAQGFKDPDLEIENQKHDVKKIEVIQF